MKYSKTWWGNRFLDALEECMDAGRLQRGRSYGGPHRLIEFEIRDGKMTARVKGNVNPYFGVYETPYYRVTVELTRIGKAKWTKILDRLGNNATWVTHLILGEVPPTIEDALADMGVSLLPGDGDDIISKCSCPDWASPCKHVAGVYYHVAGLLDRDPFLLFELRGLDRRKLFKATARTEFGRALSDGAGPEPDPEVAAGDRQFPAVRREQAEADPSDLRRFWLGKPLPADPLAAQPLPPVGILAMRRAGDYPEFWSADASFLDAMGRVYERIARGLPMVRTKGEALINSR